MMPLGLFAAVGAIAITSVQIDVIGATNLPIVPPTALVEPKIEITNLKTPHAIAAERVSMTYTDPGVAEVLASMEKNAKPEIVSTEKMTKPDTDRRSAIKFGKDDEKSTDWIK